MESYKIYWKKSAENDLLSLDQKIVPRIIDKIESLAKNPFPIHTRKLHGTNKIKKIRVGNYRIVYLADTEENIVTIYYISQRKEVYRRI
jgi:mRNA interferase RelE/StbE